MVLICKGINQRSNINTYRNNLIKYNRIISINTINEENIENVETVSDNSIIQINTQVYNNVNKRIIYDIDDTSNENKT
jgi:hypothetical protein